MKIELGHIISWNLYSDFSAIDCHAVRRTICQNVAQTHGTNAPAAAKK
jgi:hypothetical protein